MTDQRAETPASTRSASDLVKLVRRWWQLHVIKSVDHEAVVAKVRDEAGWDARYAFMLIMSAGIAVLGLLLSSPAVIIGAMLISPLMGPIIGFGFALATFDSDEIRRTLGALAGGVVLAVLFCALVVLMSPLQNVTAEIAARTRPNLFDLMVALFSALAGAYAMIRGRAGTIVGVAIATALMPPLAVVGFGLATLNATVFNGALLLFFTNFVTIAVSAAVMARLYGFGRALSPRQTMLQSGIILGLFIALAVPLGITLRQIAWETVASRQAREVISSQFPNRARISQIDIDYDATPLKISATMLTPQYRADVERDAGAMLSKLFRQPVDLSVEQIRVDLETGAAEAAQLAAAQASERQRAADLQVSRLTDQLALVAGVSAEAVLVDREHRRAVVTAVPLPGAGLATYQVLEQRVAAIDSNWQISLTPPAAPLPAIGFSEGKPDPQALALAIWAGQRIRLPIGIAGPAAQAEAVATALREAGIDARISGGGSVTTLRWLAPGI